MFNLCRRQVTTVDPTCRRGALIGLLSLLTWIAAPSTPAQEHGLRGEYGFLSSSALGRPEGDLRGRVRVMAQEYGIREFMVYDWFADYSTPVRGKAWKDAFFHSHDIRLDTLRAAIDEVHRQGGRAWAYVQAVAAEEDNLDTPGSDIWKLRDSRNEAYRHPPGDRARFPTYFPNAAWAVFMVDRWAPDIKALGFDGIHWDTLGPIAGDRGAEVAGWQAFLTTAHERLKPYGLLQTMNFVELHGWDRALVTAYCEFPYAEVWFNETERRYYNEMDHTDMAGLRGVLAMYPSVQKPAGWSEADVIIARREEARRHRLVYVVVGDGERRMRHEYWPDTVPLSEKERDALRLPPAASPPGVLLE